MSAATTMPRVHLNVLSNSAIACFRRCPREFFYRYKMLRRPRRASEALRFGTFFHLGLNAWWREDGDALARYQAALHAMQDRAAEREEDSDPVDLVKAEELMLGYSARWGDEELFTVGVEVPFEVPLTNPDTGAASKTYRIGGKIDVIARKGQTTTLVQVEHKTTSEDLGVGTAYWRNVSALDPQISTYLTGARAAGYPLESCVYDVIRKVDLKPLKATPAEQRKYTKPTKADPVSRLYANQREEDETIEEYRKRVRQHIADSPERYYARGPIVRLERDEREHAGDVWQTAWFIREAENAGRFPRSANSCRRFHRFCDYFEVCSGEASIDDDTRFRSAATAHEELAEV